MIRYADFTFNPSQSAHKTPSGLILSFFDAYKRYPAKAALYLLIDEYDNFANSILFQDLEPFKTITRSGGFMKDFYATIKAAAGDGGTIARTFITGVSSVSLDSLTSGFHISRNITSWDAFN